MIRFVALAYWVGATLFLIKLLNLEMATTNLTKLYLAIVVSRVITHYH